MKKLILSVAILAVAASCSKNEVTEVPQTNAISFSTLNDRVTTKSANDDESDYHVLANIAGTTSSWFIDEALDNNDAIISGQQYFYPNDGSDVTFYAYAPYMGENENLASNEEIATSFTYEVPGSVDLTIATDLTQASGDVELEFSHALAKVSFVVELDDALTSAYSIAESDYSSMAAELVVEESKGTVSLVSGDITHDETGTNGTYSGAMSYMVIPQDLSTGDTFTVDISGLKITNLTTESYEFEGELKQIDLLGATASIDEYEAGMHYVYTITITGTAYGTPDDDEGDEGDEGDETPTEEGPIFGTEIKISASIYAGWDYDASGDYATVGVEDSVNKESNDVIIEDDGDVAPEEA